MPSLPKKDLLNVKADPKSLMELASRISAARTSFRGYVKLMHPEFDLQPFQEILIECLDRLEKRTLTLQFAIEYKLPGWGKLQALSDAGAIDLDKPVYRVLINMPPRHGKSQLGTCLFTAYFTLRNPKRKTLAQSYSDNLAKDFGGKVQSYVKHPFSKQAYPELVMDPQYQAKDFWRTKAGGQVAFVGLEGTTTGRPANLLLTDDPIKGPKEANSEAMRRQVRDIYDNSLDARREPELADESGYEAPPIELMTLTRWHPEDLAGHVMSEEGFEQNWLHLKFRAIEEIPTGKKIDTGMKDDRGFPILQDEVEYQTLWPGRFDPERFLKIKQKNEKTFNSLYQNEPIIEGGNLVKKDWFQRYTERPFRLAATVFGVDTAFSKSAMADSSVFVRAGVDTNGDIYILDIEKGKWSYPELKAKAIQLNSTYRGKDGFRAFYVENKASGQSLIQDLKATPGVSVIPIQPSADKVTRLHLVMPMVEGGRVFLPREAPWLDDFLAEITQFPTGKHDDQVDAFVYALDALSRINVGASQDLFGSIEDIARSTMPLEHQPGLQAYGSLGKDGLPKALGEF